MKTCTYDNPATLSRECWKDGRLVCRYTRELLIDLSTRTIPGFSMFFGANVGPWKSGQMIGDPGALGEEP